MSASIDLVALFYYSANSLILSSSSSCVCNNCIRLASRWRRMEWTRHKIQYIFIDRTPTNSFGITSRNEKKIFLREWSQENGHSTRWAPLQDELSGWMFHIIFAFSFLFFTFLLPGEKEETHLLCLCFSHSSTYFFLKFPFSFLFIFSSFLIFLCARCMGI